MGFRFFVRQRMTQIGKKTKKKGQCVEKSARAPAVYEKKTPVGAFCVMNSRGADATFARGIKAFAGIHQAVILPDLLFG